ncbi:MAG: stage IV sporulation protein A [Bacillota bacterium]
MTAFDVYQDIAARTGGDIYIGVVGPVRTGKSTFIKRFMELVVLPNIKDHYDKERAQDELPQSGAGKTIMTTEPKFIPGEAVTIYINDNLKMNVRMVDCVGYAVDGALGYEEFESPRLVRTPWSEQEMTFEEAAELGTKKVIDEHSTIGAVVLTDGSITNLERQQYIQAERRVIEELRTIGKPFVIILNSVHPNEESTVALSRELEKQYAVPVLPVDCLKMQEKDIYAVMEKLLYMFPVREIGFTAPGWVEELGPEHWLYARFREATSDAVKGIEKVMDIEPAIEKMQPMDFIAGARLDEVDLGKGSVSVILDTPSQLYYEILTEVSGFNIEGDHHIMRIVKELAVAKKEYDRISTALSDVRASGYGVVVPEMDDINFNEPELIRQGNRFGVKLKASAASIHMIRADIFTTVSPLVGTEKQGEDFVKYLTEEFEKDPSKIWQTDFLGKSLYELVKEGIQSKLMNMPENAQGKLQETLTKIINEGSGGLICIII